MKIEIDKSDFREILDALKVARRYFVGRDKINEAVNLAPFRYSPITAKVDSAFQRVAKIWDEADSESVVIESADGENIGSGE